MHSNTSKPRKYGHRFVHNISKCISPMKLFCYVSDLAEISKKIRLPTHHLWFIYWPGAEQASCHYMKQRWPFWRMHMCVIWPQWVNELSVLLKTEYWWRGNIHVVVNRDETTTPTARKKTCARFVGYIVALSKCLILWPSDSIWRHRSGSALVQVMDCCL